jgi:meso-butanediol dehydrogenase/(S,S)-butanediol dehydrogenase/diacetyl reductase
MGRVSGRTIVVTRGGSGIGEGFCVGLAAEGGNVAVVGLDADAASRVADRITTAGGQAIALTANVAYRDEVASAFAEAREWGGSLDVVFNNAGFNKPMPFLEVTEENWHAIMNVNGLRVLIGIQEAAKLMIPQGGGKIINTASVAGRQGYPDFAPYCASKFAVNALTQAGARQLAQFKITVNSFAPGVVATPLWVTLDKDLLEMGATSQPGESVEAFSADILLGHAAAPEELVGTALYLASSDSDYLTGQTIMIDGGKVLV